MHRFQLRFVLLALLLCPLAAFAALPPDGYSEFSKVVPVVQRLYPEYRMSDGVSCGAVPRTSSWQNLAFYSVGRRGRRALPPLLTILLLESPKPNAFALRGYDEAPAIVLSRGLLERLKTPSELAFVLAHELAHISHNHFPLEIPGLVLSDDVLEHVAKVHQRWELVADKEAQEALLDRGFSIEAAPSLLERLEAFEGHGDVRNHPSTAARIAALIGQSRADA